MSNVEYRPAVADDVPFILDSWMKSWRKSPWAGCIVNNSYFKVQRETIEQLIARGAKLEVACDPSKPTHILGWSCAELTTDPEPRTVIHYIYVKDPYLRLVPSIGQTLVQRASGSKPGYYTHRYRQVQDACDYKGGWRHAPEIARRDRKENPPVQRDTGGGDTDRR